MLYRLVMLTILFLFLSACTADKPAVSRPNIVLIVADDLDFHHIGFMSKNSPAKTPTLDALANSGIVFTNTYNPGARCRPTLGTLLTGEYPHTNGIYANFGVWELETDGNPSPQTLPKLLHDHGYATFLGGKFWEHELAKDVFDAGDEDDMHFVREGQEQLFSFLEENAGQKPFFIWWAPKLPHSPHNAPSQFVSMFPKQDINVPVWITAPADINSYQDMEQQYLAAITWFDDSVGKLLGKLHSLDQYNNTLFVFIADNGWSFEHLSKGSVYESGIRTPLVFSWKNHIPASIRTGRLTDTVDVYATILDFAGIDTNPDLPSRSLHDIIKQQPGPASPDAIFGAAYPAHSSNIEPTPRPERDVYALYTREDNWKYIVYIQNLKEKDASNLQIKRFFIDFPARTAGDRELYDLELDPYEKNNLANLAEHQQRITQLHNKTLRWWYCTGGKPITGFPFNESCSAHDPHQ